MKTIFILALFAGSTAFAAFPTVKVDSISGAYENKRGKAFARHASYDLDVVKVEHSELEVSFNNIDKNLVINDMNTSVRLKMDFSFLNVFKSLSFSDVNIRSNPKEFSSELGELRVFIDPSEYVLSNIQTTSDLTQTDVDVSNISMLEGFLMNGDVSVESISLASSQKLEQVRTALEKELPKEFLLDDNDLKDLKGIAIPLIGKQFRLVMKDKTFSGSVLLDSWLNAWMHFGGALEHDKKESELRIELRKARLGFFSVRGVLLRTIDKLALETVKVRGNWIIVDLDQVAASGRNASK